MKKIRTVDAVGTVLCHDIAHIEIGKVKDTPFRRGQTIQAEDIPNLLALGKAHLFVMEEEDIGKIHEEDVAQDLFSLCQNDHITGSGVREGKIEAIAEIDGLFKVDVTRLHAINSIGEITIVTKKTNTPVKAGQKLAGMRCIPLLLDPKQMVEAQAIGGSEPLFQLLPFTIKKAGVVTTGSEVYNGTIKDAFTPIIKERLAPYGVQVMAHETVTDDTEQIKEAIAKCVDQGAEIIFCTGGMSVDPDDLTPGAIKAMAEEVVTYGLPVLPGSMFCISYMAGGLPLIGVPGGVLFSAPTAFDVLLPRFLSHDHVTKEECIAMGHGGFLA